MLLRRERAKRSGAIFKVREQLRIKKKKLNERIFTEETAMATVKKVVPSEASEFYKRQLLKNSGNFCKWGIEGSELAYIINKVSVIQSHIMLMN